MPTYEYQCTAGHRFDVFQSMTDEPLKKCKKCRKKAIRLMGSGLGVHFKGAGFYETDYKRKSSSTGSSKSPSKGAKTGPDKK